MPFAKAARALWPIENRQSEEPLAPIFIDLEDAPLWIVPSEEEDV